MSTISTDAPRSASAAAMPLPMPRAAPVTMTDFPPSEAGCE
jgi:hypothetical protein